MLGGLAAAAVAAMVAYLAADRRCRGQIADLQTQAAVAQQESAGLQGQLASEKQETSRLREALSAAEREIASGKSQLAAVQANIVEQKRLLDEANTRLTDAFASVSRDALEKNNAAFLEMAQAKFQTLSTEAAGTLDTRKAQIEGLLKPMQELLNTYQQRLAEIEKSRLETYGQLRQQIGVLTQTENTLAMQTAQLVTALTRPNVRGQWGEITLRKLVELAGMSDHCDFVEQLSVTSDAEEGAARLRPDMVVNLPAQRSIVIDAKAVLGAFLDAASASDETTRKTHLARHAQLVRNRAKELAAKAYWSQFKQTPEFVVLFLPGESFLYAAVEQDPMLIEECFGARVILATPTTLIALLKTVEYGWRQQAMSENAELIRQLGTEIYDRLAVLAAHMAKLGSSLDGAVGHYNNAVKSLESRLLVSARKMGELGVTKTKELPDEVKVVDTRTQELSGTLNPGKSPLWNE